MMGDEGKRGAGKLGAEKRGMTSRCAEAAGTTQRAQAVGWALCPALPSRLSNPHLPELSIMPISQVRQLWL